MGTINIKYITMRFVFVLIFCCGMNTVFGQKDTTRRDPGIIAYRDEVPDSSLRILDYEKEETKPETAIYINGKYYRRSIFHSITPVLDKYKRKIRSFNIVEEDTIINGTLYHGKIHVTFDSVFEIKIKEISLFDIKEKYTDLKDYPAVFTIDGELITSDYDSYIIDENAILQIAFGKIKNPKIAFVKILTKTEKNIKDRNAFHIRGLWEK
jgi:hypothetical protein